MMTEDLMQLLRRASTGDAFAMQAILAHFHSASLVPEEEESIHFYLRQASRQSHYAIYLRALLYDKGYGVKSDADMAFLLMREAAAKGNARATYEVGRRFLEGIGVEKNYDNALQWLEVAALSPHYDSDAMYDLGHLYEEGWGVEADKVQAKAWYEKAANKGHLKAKEKLSHE